MTFTLPARHFYFNDVPITPDTFRGQHQFSDKFYGRSDNDGVTSFPDTIVAAAELDVDEGFELLFLLSENESGRRIIGSYPDRKFADPNLLWSLLKEAGHKTLKYLRDTYDVSRIVCLRRTFINPDGVECSLGLFVTKGEWTFEFVSLNSRLSLGEVILTLK